MKKIIFTLIVVVIISLAYYLYKQSSLQKEYVDVLKKEQVDYVNTFYKIELTGVVNYIKNYGYYPPEYVVSVKDKNNIQTTIGKVEILNFTNVKLGDSIFKPQNSFVLKVFKTDTVIYSTVKYKVE